MRRVAYAVVVLWLAAGGALAQAPQRAPPAGVRPYCVVPATYFARQRDEAIAHGQNIMTMTNSGQPCSRTLTVAPRAGAPRIPVTVIELPQPPTNGTVTI